VSSRERILIAVIAVFVVFVAAVTICVVRGNIFDPLNRGWSVVVDDFVGQKKAAIEARHGKPSNEWAGYYGRQPIEFTKQHSLAISTACERGGGILYLSFEQKNGEWVCFKSHWMPNGAVF
jgi:hypothetical protein